MQRMEQVSEFKEKLVAVNRVTKVVKGGRNFRFSALVVVGDEKGRVGAGMGKAAEISEAIRKGTEDAKKHLINVPVLGTSIPHESIGRFGTGKVVLLPAPEGTGVIAGGAAARCWSWRASAISAPRATAPTTRSTWSRRRWKASSSCAAPRRSPSCVARPSKRFWAEEDDEDETANHA